MIKSHLLWDSYPSVIRPAVSLSQLVGGLADKLVNIIQNPRAKLVVDVQFT